MTRQDFFKRLLAGAAAVLVWPIYGKAREKIAPCPKTRCILSKEGHIITLHSLEQRDVQLAIDVARPGDIIQFPAGHATWDGGFTGMNFHGKLVGLRGAPDSGTVLEIKFK